MSKAFTKEDDAAGVSLSHSTLSVPPGRFRITATGAREAAAHPDPRVHEALHRADTLEPALRPERAVLGVTVRVRNEDGDERSYRLVPPEEVALLGTSHHVASVEAPVGRALLGAQVGDVREVRTPRGLEELEILALEGESGSPS